MENKIHNLSSILEEWKSFDKDFTELEALQKCYAEAVTNFKKLESNCKTDIGKYSKEVSRIWKSLKCIRPSNEKEKEDVMNLRKVVAARREELRDMSSILPKENGSYLKIVLGSVNVSLLNQSDKFKYKDEYERFKFSVTMLILILSFFNILFDYKSMDALLHFLLVWYYCTLTIRESILAANGSRIKGWWRTHHFLSTTLAGVLILWHDGSSYQLFRNQFMWYSCYSSFVQFLQYNYQQGCLYRLRALGERHNMDITIDGFHSWMWRGLKFLLPFLIIGYCWQLYHAYTLFQMTMQIENIEWQVPASSLIFWIIFCGNSITTGMVVHQKLNLKDLILRKLQ